MVGFTLYLLTHLAFDQRVETTNEFLYNTQRSTMQGLHEADPGQLYVVIGTIRRVINPSNFGYTACKCSRGVEPEMQMLSCEECEKDVNNLCARYFLESRPLMKLVVSPWCCWTQLQGLYSTKHVQRCFNKMSMQLGQVPHDIYRLVNQTILFKVEKHDPSGDPNQQAFIVRKICLDAFAINELQKPKQFKGIDKDLIIKGDAGILLGAKPLDVGSSSNIEEPQDDKEAEDINILMNLFKSRLHI